MRRTVFTLGLGALALSLGPLLVRLAPDPAIPPFAAWRFPPSQTVLSEDPGTDIEPQVPTPLARQTATLLLEGRSYQFFRLHYAVSRADQDMVPWFEGLHGKRWVRSESGVREQDGVRLNLLVLEHVGNGEKRVLAYTLRVGSVLTPSFNIAKLVQIPAKLAGQNVFEILVLSSECASDCRQATGATAAALAQIVNQNLQQAR